MKCNKMKNKSLYIIVFFMAILLQTRLASAVFAETFNGFTMSPMTQLLILNPGETYNGQFSISNPSNNTISIDYEVSVDSFYRDNDNNVVFENVDGTGEIAKWITLNSPKTGSIAPNETNQISYTIQVPDNAPAGGQYASITAKTVPSKENETGTAVLRESLAMAYLIYAEIAGNTIHDGEIMSVEVPSFLFEGDIYGDATIKNTGNTHEAISSTIQVFPLFSNEEVFTNEENPISITVLPNRTRYTKITWDETPAMGIFNVIYTVEFEGVTTQVSKIVIKCPIWLLFIIIFVIMAIIIYFIAKARKRGAARAKKETA